MAGFAGEAKMPVSPSSSDGGLPEAAATSSSIATRSESEAASARL